MSRNDRDVLGRAIFDAVGIERDMTQWDDPAVTEQTREEYRREADYLLSMGWHHECYPALDYVRRQNLKQAEEVARLEEKRHTLALAYENEVGRVIAQAEETARAKTEARYWKERWATEVDALRAAALHRSRRDD